ncbi:hypothetical protein [uncultured Kordia sp.]|uniref:hypothetical protein n=1 Tax=uncultured Kordia sp. TaxID=507699 RepID=UPI002606D72B|nr:hypothetical protein [uncultured Kordia sp.]
MKEITFHAEAFDIEGIQIPEITATKGRLIRMYIPFYSQKRVPLHLDLTLRIIEHFQNLQPNLYWAKHYSPNRYIELIRPLTVERYLTHKMKLDTHIAIQIATDLNINLKDRFEHIEFVKKRALIIKALFQKNDCILLDYYAIDVSSIKFLETVVNTEIEKGKSAIAFDNLQFAEETEPFTNIHRIEIHV